MYPELVCGAVARDVYCPTESPEESCFKALADIWTKLNKDNYNLPTLLGDCCVILSLKLIGFWNNSFSQNVGICSGMTIKKLGDCHSFFLEVPFLRVYQSQHRHPACMVWWQW